jgi:environmental stress-induced protein Ves
MTSIVHADAVNPQPWKNGCGVTRALCCVPAESDWRLRLSLADITADAPFSAFPGVQRWFVVLQGEGVALHFGDDSVQQRVGDVPLVFDGAEAPSCRLLGGATRDLNLMLRSVEGVMLVAEPGVEWDAPWPWRARFCSQTLSLHLGLAQGPLWAHTPGYWIGADL